MTIAKTIQVNKRYLCFPAAFSGQEVRLIIESCEKRLHDISLWVSPDYTCQTDRPGFIGWIDLSAFMGGEVVLRGDLPDNWFNYVYLQDTKPDVVDRGERPQIHFTARQGWINDPNGLIVYEGVYHLFYQYNPFSKSWGNMHWGHATSTDLVIWTEHDPAIYPNAYGVAFSGCAVIDSENVAGLGAGAMILYYTAYAEKSPDIAGAPFEPQQAESTIRRYYSLDHGQTFHFDPDFVIEQIVPGNRDPKVFYHLQSEAWIMVLFLEHHEFAVLRSKDLNEWSVSQRFSLENTWECPDLFQLEDPESHRSYWIFWTGDGYYYIGDFDGRCFTNISGQKQSTLTPLAYAAQTFFNTTNRIISLCWLRTANFYSPYNGMMSLPKELSLRQTEAGLVLVQMFVHEICSRLISTKNQVVTNQFSHVHVGGAFQLKFKIDRQSCTTLQNVAEIDILEKKISLDLRSLTLSASNTSFKIPDRPLLDFDIFIDYGIIEIIIDGGTIYTAIEYYFSSLTGNVRLTASEETLFRDIEINDFLVQNQSAASSGQEARHENSTDIRPR